MLATSLIRKFFYFLAGILSDASLFPLDWKGLFYEYAPITSSQIYFTFVRLISEGGFYPAIDALCTVYSHRTPAIYGGEMPGENGFCARFPLLLAGGTMLVNSPGSRC